MTERPPSSFERHAQSVVQAVITALLLWVGVTTFGLAQGVTELRVRVEERSAQTAKDIEEMKRDIKSLQPQRAAQ